MDRFTENPYFYKIAPERPAIRKLGTVMCDMVETTPVVFGGRLYRFEYFRSGAQNEANPSEESHFRFRNLYTNALSKPFGRSSGRSEYANRHSVSESSSIRREQSSGRIAFASSTDAKEANAARGSSLP